MKNIDGVLYYNLRESGYYLGITNQTLRNYIDYNEFLKENGRKPIIPEPTTINNVTHFSEYDIKKIQDAMRHFKKGDFLEFRKNKTSYQKLKEENVRLRNIANEMHGGVR